MTKSSVGRPTPASLGQTGSQSAGQNTGPIAQKGSLVVVGIGPGAPELMTFAASDAIAAATDLVGYTTYLKRVPERAGQQRHGTDNREEISRSRHALELAAAGRHVAVVTGGDPGVFAMAAAVLEAVEAGDASWRGLDIRIEPGVTAMLAAAARVGAPLGADFCAISLSDNLKRWSTIAARLEAAARADFVIALYNPASKARPHQFEQALTVLRACKPPETVVVMVRAAGTKDAGVVTATLGDVDAGFADMRTLVIIGASTTRLIERPAGAQPWVYTPRGEADR